MDRVALEAHPILRRLLLAGPRRAPDDPQLLRLTARLSPGRFREALDRVALSRGVTAALPALKAFAFSRAVRGVRAPAAPGGAIEPLNNPEQALRNTIPSLMLRRMRGYLREVHPDASFDRAQLDAMSELRLSQDLIEWLDSPAIEPDLMFYVGAEMCRWGRPELLESPPGQEDNIFSGAVRRGAIAQLDPARAKEIGWEGYRRSEDEDAKGFLMLLVDDPEALGPSLGLAVRLPWAGLSVLARRKEPEAIAAVEAALGQAGYDWERQNERMSGWLGAHDFKHMTHPRLIEKMARAILDPSLRESWDLRGWTYALGCTPPSEEKAELLALAWEEEGPHDRLMDMVYGYASLPTLRRLLPLSAREDEEARLIFRAPPLHRGAGRLPPDEVFDLLSPEFSRDLQLNFAIGLHRWLYRRPPKPDWVELHGRIELPEYPPVEWDPRWLPLAKAEAARGEVLALCGLLQPGDSEGAGLLYERLPEIRAKDAVLAALAAVDAAERQGALLHLVRSWAEQKPTAMSVPDLLRIYGRPEDADALWQLREEMDSWERCRSDIPRDIETWLFGPRYPNAPFVPLWERDELPEILEPVGDADLGPQAKLRAFKAVGDRADLDRAGDREVRDQVQLGRRAEQRPEARVGLVAGAQLDRQVHADAEHGAAG